MPESPEIPVCLRTMTPIGDAAQIGSGARKSTRFVGQAKQARSVRGSVPSEGVPKDWAIVLIFRHEMASGMQGQIRFADYICKIDHRDWRATAICRMFADRSA